MSRTEAKQGGLLILLLGNRIQPATMLAYHLRPAQVVCIGTTDQPKTLDEVAHALTYLLGPNRLAGERSVAPYRPDDTLAAVSQIAADQPDLAPAIGLTGCPVPMSIAGYEAGRRLRCPVLYVNTIGAEIVDFTQPDRTEPLRVRFAIDDYLAICGLQIVGKGQPGCVSAAADQQAAAQRLGQAGDAGIALIAALRAAGLTPARLRRLRLTALTAETRTLLQHLANRHILTDLAEHPDGSIAYRIPTAGEVAFLNGDWLEEYIWGVAEALRSQEPDLFDAVGKRITFCSATAEREIDFIALRGGVPLIASCKSSANPWQKEDLDELAAIAQLLGGNYVIRLFIAYQNPPSPAHPRAADPFGQFQEQARRQRIVLVTNRQLGQLAEILRKEMRDPTYKLM